MGPNPRTLDNQITNGNTYKQMIKKKKPAQIHFHSKRSYTNGILYDYINMDNTIPGSMNACNSLRYMIILTDLISISHI